MIMKMLLVQHRNNRRTAKQLFILSVSVERLFLGYNRMEHLISNANDDDNMESGLQFNTIW